MSENGFPLLIRQSGLGLSFVLAFGLGGCTSTQAFFSADQELVPVVTSEIQAAEESVHLAIYTFTQGDIRDALYDAAMVRGVEVLVCADRDQSYILDDQQEALRILRDAGVQVRVADGFGGGIMHHKLAVIDGHTVVTGSFNYTRSANEINDENLLVLSSPDLAGRYEQAFQDLWNRSEDF